MSGNLAKKELVHLSDGPCQASHVIIMDFFFFCFPKREILDPPNLKEFAVVNFKFDENGREFSKRVENTVGKRRKLLVTSNFSFAHSVFKRLVMQTHKNQGLCGKALKWTSS